MHIGIHKYPEGFYLKGYVVDGMLASEGVFGCSFTYNYCVFTEANVLISSVRRTAHKDLIVIPSLTDY